MKKTLCLDFDGVLHSYASGWKGIDVIPDPPVDGALHFLTQAVQVFEVCIYSTRSSSAAGRDAMREWLTMHGLLPDVLFAIQFPTEKPSAFVTLDDRALTFVGVFPSLDELQAFQPWNKKKAKP